MDNALSILEKNKEEALDAFRDILKEPTTRYAEVQQIIQTVALAGISNKISSKLGHLMKYVRVIDMLLEIPVHRDHFKSSDFEKIAQFLLGAGNRLHEHEQLTRSEYVKLSSEILKGFDLLLKANEAVCSEFFGSIVATCGQILDKVGSRETLCHLHIMGCARQLIYFGFKDADPLARAVIALGRFRNPDLTYEAMQYASLVRQPWDVLMTLNPQTIPSHQVEFLPSEEFRMKYFRPSAEADLSLFVGGIALSRSFDNDIQSQSASNLNRSKRQKIEISGLLVMKLAFRNPRDIPDTIYVSILEWLEAGPSLEDPAVIFWAFVVLAIGVVNYPLDVYRLWDVAINRLQHPGYSSGSCFLISTLIPRLLDPLHISSNRGCVQNDVIGRIANLLKLVSSSSSSPPLSSGSLMMWSALNKIRILDEDFQRKKTEALKIWYGNEITSMNSSLPLTIQLIDYRAPANYLDQDKCVDLESISEYIEVEFIRHQDVESIIKCNPIELDQPESIITDDSLQCPQRPTSNLRESLVYIALSAHRRTDIPTGLYKSHTAAFSVDDLRAFTWFSGLATYFNWPELYTTEALSLANWDSAAERYPGLADSLLLMLQRPTAVVSTVLSGRLYPSLLSPDSGIDSSQLTEVEKFMKSYAYQRSPLFLKILCQLVGLKLFKVSPEAAKLRQYLLQVSSSQTQFSRLKKYLIKFSKLTRADERIVLDQMCGIYQLAVLQYLDNNDEFDLADLKVFSHENQEDCAAFFLAYTRHLSIAQLLLRKTNVDLEKIQNLIPMLHLENWDQLYSAFAVPMVINDVAILSRSDISSEAFARIRLFMKPFTELDLSLSAQQIAGITEQVLKETCNASDTEKSRAIDMSHSFAKAHLSHNDAFFSRVYESFLYNACASVNIGNLRAQKSLFHALSEIMENVHFHRNLKAIKEMSIPHITAAIYCAGLKEAAFDFLQKFDADSPINKLQNLEINSDLVSIISACCALNASEIWSKVIDSLIETCSHLSMDQIYDAFAKLDSLQVESLIAWTDYLSFHNAKWLAVLGRLEVVFNFDVTRQASRLLFDSIPSLNIGNVESSEKQKRQNDVLSMDSISASSESQFKTKNTQGSQDLQDPLANTSIESHLSRFQMSLIRLYAILPYRKKRVLNTFLQRSPLFKESVYPSDVFRESNWELELKFRPLNINKNYADKDGAFDIAQRLADLSLRLMNQPVLGPYVVLQVPELMIEVVPLMITVGISRPQAADCQKQLYAELQELISICITSEEDSQKRLALDVYQQCYRYGVNFPLGDRAVADACYSIVVQGKLDSLYFSKIGSMSVELIWNREPWISIESELMEKLRVFLNEMSKGLDPAFSKALPRKKHIPNLSEISASTSRVQQLQADMVCSEVVASTSNTSMTAGLTLSFERSGLWNLAQEVQGETNIYDLERAWWLGQWECYKPALSKRQVYSHNEFGPLIGLATEKLDIADTLAMLKEIRSPLIRNVTDVSYSCASKFVEDPISRRLHEISTFRNGQYEKYVSALETACSHFRTEKNVNRTLEYAAKLEKFIATAVSYEYKDVNVVPTDHATDFLEQQHHHRTVNVEGQIRVDSKLLEQAKSASHFANAHIQWMLGQHSSALESLKGLLDRFELQVDTLSTNASSHNGRNSRSVSPADVSISSISPLDYDRRKYPFDVGRTYCTIGTWSRESRNEPDNKILHSYFLEAMKYRDSHNAEHLYHAFAHFCSQAYQDSYIQMSIQNARHTVNNLNPQFKHITKIIKSGMEGYDTEKKHKLNKMYRSVHAQLKSSTSDLQELQKYKKSLLIRCAENYMLGMIAGDTYEDDMASFISLWLEHHENVELNEMVDSQLGRREEESVRIPVRKFLPWISQLSSRLGSTSASSSHSSRREVALFQDTLHRIILDASRQHPYHTLWHLFKIASADTGSKKISQGRVSAADMIIRQTRTYRPDIVDSIGELFKKMIELGSVKQSSDDRKQKHTIVSLVGRRNATFWRTKLPKLKVPMPTVTIPVNNHGDYSDVPVITKLLDPIKVAGGLSAPKILAMMDSSGNVHRALLKTSNDDLRQDAIMEQVFSIASTTLTKRHPNLYVRTYNVIPLNATVGLIEFVQNTTSLIDILESMHAKYGDPKHEFTLSQARKAMNMSRQNSRVERIHVYKEVAAHTRPQMRHYWTEQFRDASSWLAAKTRWCRSSAVMSILGYIIGLGDRHCSNLLVDSTNGDVIHIDLGIAFDQGKLLQIPETVPFRLTRDIVDGMGICGTSGVFMQCAETTLSELREHADRIMTVLEVLKHDTLYTWKLPVSVLRNVQIQGTEPEPDLLLDNAPQVDDGQAEHALMGVRAKLRDSLSCEATVRDLVMQARDAHNLALIYSGWSPFY